VVTILFSAVKSTFVSIQTCKYTFLCILSLDKPLSTRVTHQYQQSLWRFKQEVTCLGKDEDTKAESLSNLPVSIDLLDSVLLFTRMFLTGKSKVILTPLASTSKQLDEKDFSGKYIASWCNNNGSVLVFWTENLRRP